MSYAQKKQLSGNKTAALVIAVLLQVSLGYALITGLAYNVIKKQIQNLKTFNVEQPPPPKEKPPPPPKNMPQVPPPPVTPPSIVTPPVVTPPPITTVVSPVITPPTPVRPPAPPPPPPAPRQTQPKSVVGNLQGLITGEDYPESAMEANQQGTVHVELSVGPSGRVTGCSVTSSSGSRDLDNATCRLLSARARFSPAQDSNGNPTTGSFPAMITWRIAQQ